MATAADDFPVAPLDGADAATPTTPDDDPRKGKGGQDPDTWTPERRARAAEAGRKGAAKVNAARKAGTPQRKALLAQIEEDVAGAAGIVGMMVLPVSPLPGGYLVKTSDELGAIVARLAESNPKMLEALTKAGGAMQYAGLIGWGAGLACAIGAQYGYVAPDGVMAERTGVAEVYDELLREGTLRVAPAPEGDEAGVAGVDQVTTEAPSDGNGSGPGMPAPAILSR